MASGFALKAGADSTASSEGPAEPGLTAHWASIAAIFPYWRLYATKSDLTKQQILAKMNCVSQEILQQIFEKKDVQI